ncbi:hypothetical protein F5Y00DRAFT_238765 [Daldinia vernicosa]|uniref:uncharacterized protein n=1 Tax=Daldinia vernicosa TaxID=114800 RepID=UPI002007CD52|nr:uncharacterized protein F5Y00DRAFT_238765 [Daldinia vernicosa]KAI0848287.1 hypothetical protein F5Y00DRAFT_238765 [Daldinia vernicosa]
MFQLPPFLIALAAAPLATPSSLVSQQIDYGSLHCPEDPTATLVTPTYGAEGAIFTICSELVLDNTGPLTAYNAILDFKSYPRWNSFIIDVALPDNVTSTPDDIYVGMTMQFTSNGLIGSLNTTSTEVISLLDPSGAEGYLINAWHYDDGIGGVGSRAEHPNVFVDLGNGSTRYLSYETYYAGLSTGTIALLKLQLQHQWDIQVRDLKVYVESL